MTWSHPVEARYPIRDRGRIQLFSMNTPNGIKVSAALEELGLPYEPHLVNIREGAQHHPAYRTLSPNGKIPALIDPTGAGPTAAPTPGRGPTPPLDAPPQPVAMCDSGAILLHLAEKTGRLLPTDPLGRSDVLQWLFLQVSQIGPMFGQLGHFHRYARRRTADTYALDRYLNETKRLLAVLEERLQDRTFVAAGELSIADLAIFPWLRALLGYYDAGDLVGIDAYPSVLAYLERMLARPAIAASLQVCRPERR